MSLIAVRMGMDRSAVERVLTREQGWRYSCLLATPYHQRDRAQGLKTWAMIGGREFGWQEDPSEA